MPLCDETPQRATDLHLAALRSKPQPAAKLLTVVEGPLARGLQCRAA